MAFFFEYDPTNELSVADMMKVMRGGFLHPMLKTDMCDPIHRVGNTILVHFSPEWNFKIDHYVNYGIVIAQGHKFKVTRLYPWNHPSDTHARAAWKENQQLKLQRAAEIIGKTQIKYYDMMGRTVPPPPKLMRTTNSYELRRPVIDTTGYLDIRGYPLPLENEPDNYDHLYDSDDSMPSLVSLNSGSNRAGIPDDSPLAPFSPRGSSVSSNASLPDLIPL
jgi:hypothetical protein